jgi:hypothetical protein
LSTLELIRSLQKKDYLKGFNLVGGTALALYIGHRKSVDVDLFSNFSFDTMQLIESVQQDFNIQLYNTAPNTIKGSIGNINVDFIAHRYPWLTEPEEIDGIHIVGLPDIVAMKLNAISSSGQRSKDFVDIYYVLKEKRHTIEEMLGFYKKKYSQKGDMHIIKSLIYFEDVDLAEWPVIIKDPHLKWSTVKRKIEKELLLTLKKN